ncbi:LPXTG cell wall anchor domain-containing protein [Nocardiopsis halotolerans]|uniref:LPXTG cell wall anchor domain-containing protein n=1 Tax=Nocardiopsis halotolerans TaxID=124252 RepID=UPI00034C468C|nr:LPXTG cell wall anchor domain-containing protein [Nocardiopsis halotolerans]
MKNTRVTARRILQGGATFAALGALSIATALPAAADGEVYGWAYASVGNQQGVSISYDGTTSNSYSGSVGDWLTFSGTSSATVNGDGVTATATVDTARVQITVSDVEQIIEENLDDEAGDGEDPEAEASEDPEGDESETEDPEGEDSEGDGSEEHEDGDSEDSGGEAPDPEEPGTEDPATEGSGAENPEGGDNGNSGEETQEPTDPVTESEPTTPPEASTESDAAAEPETIVLNEENTELSSGSDEILLDAALSGVTTTTTQSWDGEISRSADIADISYPEIVTLDSGEQVTVLIDIQSYEGVEEFVDEESGVSWNDAFTGFGVTFTVQGADAPFHYVDLAESVASIGTVQVDDGDDGDGTGGGDDKGDDGDEKPAPTHPEDKGDDKGDEQDSEKLENAESLAQTGSPLTGLIAAGAAVAAGGGLAAFFARRKKNASDSAAETSEG